MQIEESAAGHNAVYRSYDLTDAYNSGDLFKWIASGKFTNIFPGCYIRKTKTIDGVTYTDHIDVIAECDPYLGISKSTSDSTIKISDHHVMIIPLNLLGLAKMNPTPSTAGGYAGSNFAAQIISKYIIGYSNAYGASHLLSFRMVASFEVNESIRSYGLPSELGSPQMWAGYDVYSALLTEAQVSGNTMFGSPFDSGESPHQVAIFRLNPEIRIFNNTRWWTRNVVANRYFTFVGVGGQSGWFDADADSAVRPFFLIK